ncbi:uncharacterized protein LOC143531175 [Bidens hawaiensis]|uniref:uncharacterized protein LOC143531175 n=1 Tax=Bidens hawaiensis TaxID=980011 RepID=UPI00404A5F2E
MDPVTALTTTTNQQPYVTNTLTGNTNTHITTSINQLRTFSTALSAFISSYDELHTHIGFINSSIEDVTVSVRNPSGSESVCDRTVNDVTEGVVLVQNPRDRVSECEVRHAVARSAENDGLSRGFDETDASKKPDVSKSHEEVEEETVPETSEVADVSKNTEEVDVFENAVEIDVLKKPEAADLLNSSKETDVETVPETYCDETMAVYRMVDNGKQSLEDVDALVAKKLEETDILIKPEQIDICKSLEETVVLKKHEEFDTLMIQEEVVALKKLEETVPETSCDQIIDIVSEQSLNRLAMRTPEILQEIDISNKVENIDICKYPEQADVLQKHEETGVLKKPEDLDTLMVSEELDISMIPEAFDTPMKPEESLPETSCDETMATVPEAIVSTQNPNRMATDGEQSHETVSTPENLEEIEELDISIIPEEIDTLEKPEESRPETSLNHTTTTVPETVVSEQNPNRMSADGKRSHEKEMIPGNLEENDVSVSKKPGKINTSKEHEENGTCTKAKEPEASNNSVLSKLERFCQSMNSKGMRWHIATHYSEMINLREEVAKALKLAEDPAKLVLNSIGQFFVQDSKTFCKPDRDTQNLTRMAAVLILECFVMISSDDGIEIATRDQEDAAVAAANWRKRMMTEGGPGHTDEVDARGLLLLISGFGIQDQVFKIQDIMDLIKASNAKGVSTALRRSVFLMPKIPEVIDLMVKNNLEVEAADVAHAFGLEDKCHPQSILGTFLHKDIRHIQDGSLFQTGHEHVRTPESLEEIDVSNKPEQTDILNKPEEIDILKKPEQTDICISPEQIDVLQKPEEIDTSKKHEEIGICKKAKKPKASKKSVVSVL